MLNETFSIKQRIFTVYGIILAKKIMWIVDIKYNFCCSFVEEPLGSGHKQGCSLSELLSHVSNKNFRHLWEHTQQKHFNSRVNTNGHHMVVTQKVV